MARRRKTTALRDVDSAWPDVEALLAAAAGRVTVLPVSDRHGEDALVGLQMTVSSPMGALTRHCGGLLVDDGWVRVLAGGCPAVALSSLPGANRMVDGLPTLVPGALVVAYDALGGVFAVNGGALPGDPGEVCYFGPDTRGWSPLGDRYGTWLEGLATADLDAFFAALRWPGWRGEVAPLRADRGVHLHPPPWTVEGRDPATVSRRAVAVNELTGQLLGVPVAP